jgi:hypothetical protein
MDIVKFTETIFSSNNKKGILTPDSDGYYTVTLGALNTYNSAGEYYTAEGALQLFENSSYLMRRIKNGSLYSELGHPKKQPNMSMSEFYNRVITIDETNVCGHISEITLDFNFGKNNPKFNNPDMIAIIGKVKPAGDKANSLQLALENPKQNAAFSIRGLTENKYRNGRVERILTNIITWDHVIEPGISIACKAHTPGLENISTEELVVKEVTDVIVDKNILKKVLNNNIVNIATEDSRELYRDILRKIERNDKVNKLSSW